MIDIKKYDEDTDNDIWDDLISRSVTNLFFFKRNFLNYHKSRLEDFSLILIKKSKVIAVFPANIMNDTIYSHAGLTFGGLIRDRKITQKDVLEIFELITTFYKAKGIKKIIYKAVPYVFSKYPFQEDLYALFSKYEAKIVKREISSIISLENKLNFSQSKKNLVNKNNLRNKIFIKELTDYCDYWALLISVLKKRYNAKPTHSLEEITNLKSEFPDNIKLYVADKDDQILAGVVIFDFGDVVHTQYMATSDDGRKEGALDIINYELINNIYNKRKYYSFGSSCEKNGYYLNEGLINQKELMGARAIALDTYEIIL
ncbi:GNAT family N-acetyltransferase [Elizabethkingia anophelis]|uniref:GNAT family N-acetyltransferase n=1 Tax=Elizabethkingia anophelis TaxID=1117645 RepID=UPI0035588167